MLATKCPECHVRSLTSSNISPRRLLIIAALGTALLTATACGGSALDPKEVLAANRAVNGAGMGSAGGPGVPAANPDGTAVDPGTGQVPGGARTPGAPTGPTGNSNASGNLPATAGGGSEPPAGSGGKAGSCVGFRNALGITDSTIKIGNSSDLSGPIPGLFASAQQATKAYVQYFNATSSICGRKLELVNMDSRLDAGADQTAYAKLCDQVFAAVGSMSAFDSGGASVAQKCGLPDVRTASTTLERNQCSTCFGAQSTSAKEFTTSIPDFFVKNYPEAVKKSAFLYINTGAAAENAKTQQNVEEQRGMKFVYTSGIDIADFNYGPYVQQMKSKGVQWVQFIGAYQQAVRLNQAMQQAGFKPQVRFHDPSAYDAAFVKSGGSAVDGVITFTNFTPLEESQPELDLYKKWLQQVAPGATPTFFGEYAWSASKLFVTQALALGGKLNRASLVNSIKGIHKWTADGLHSPMDVGGKHSPSCARFLQLTGGKWVPLKGTKYICKGYTTAR